MHTSTTSIMMDDKDKFFAIGESYCPTMQRHQLNFDDIIRQTLWYYVDNVNKNVLLTTKPFESFL